MGLEFAANCVVEGNVIPEVSAEWNEIRSCELLFSPAAEASVRRTTPPFALDGHCCTPTRLAGRLDAAVPAESCMHLILSGMRDL